MTGWSSLPGYIHLRFTGTILSVYRLFTIDCHSNSRMKLSTALLAVPLLVAAAPVPILRRQESLEQATDRLLFSTSISSFLAARSVRDPPELNWISNGCSYSPEEPLGFDFEPSCWRHDFGYRNYKAQGRFDAGKSSIDTQFKHDMDNQCATEGILKALCGGVADLYYRAVVEFGSKLKREMLEQ